MVTRGVDEDQDERRGVISLTPLVFLSSSDYHVILAERDVIKLSSRNPSTFSYNVSRVASRLSLNASPNRLSFTGINATLQPMMRLTQHQYDLLYVSPNISKIVGQVLVNSVAAMCVKINPVAAIHVMSRINVCRKSS